MTAVGNGRAAPLGQRLHVLLRGIEQLRLEPSPRPPRPEARASADAAPSSPARRRRGRLGPLPVGELLHPVSLLAVVVLMGNDWWAKQAHPGWLTGKLSDVAGLVVAPLVLSSLAGLAWYAIAATGVAVDPSLRRRRLLLAIAVVAAVFVATKLSAVAAGAVVSGLRLLGGRPHIVVDPTDLLALPALLVPWWIGGAELRLVPRGRVHAVLRRPAAPRAVEPTGAVAPDVVAHLDEVAFEDVRAAGADPALVAQLAAAVAAARVGVEGAGRGPAGDDAVPDPVPDPIPDPILVVNQTLRRLARAPARSARVARRRPGSTEGGGDA